ncbi:Uncharacterised protein [Mycobacterium tuberculosis]|nr:Uncharacterised protein [Mycobacterium tuberculosis]
MVQFVSNSKKPCKQHTSEFCAEILKLAECICMVVANC